MKKLRQGVDKFTSKKTSDKLIEATVASTRKCFHCNHVIFTKEILSGIHNIQ